MTTPNRTLNFPPAAALPFLLLPFLILIMACSGNAPASRPSTPATIHPPPTATPAPPATPALPTESEPPDYPPADVPFTQITAGRWHACGLREDATALCWGRHNDYGEQNPPPGKFRQLSAGWGFTCGLRDDGRLLCWGINDRSQANPPPGEFTAVAAGRAHACALAVAALAVCWGEGYHGGWKIEAGGAAFTAIDSGPDYGCGLTTGQDLLCWRSNEPPEITPGPFRDLAAGVSHSCALREDGSARCQGDNRYRQAEPPSTPFTAIAAGWHHSCGITGAGRLECWGAAHPGAPGQRLAAPDGAFTTLSIGWRHSCALRPEGYAVCWYQLEAGPSSPVSPHLTEAFGGRVFEQPVDLFPWPGGGLAVVDRQGAIIIHKDPPDDGAEQAGLPPWLALDLTASTYCCTGENGMLSAAVDPEFEQFPYLYVYYNAKIGDADPEGRLSRFPVVDGYAQASSELVMIKFSDPARFHHGGAVRFGPDGMLHLGIGDNQRWEDTQDLTNLRGKIIRIDPRGATAKQPYRTPADNPFVNTPMARPEIWAYGMRNPWRMAFDRQGRLFVADVGGGVQEEVSIAVAGANLGYSLLEGHHCHKASAQVCANIAANSLTPIHTYDRSAGCAIIGGVTVPWLDDGFVFGDYCTAKLWLLSEDNEGGWHARELAQLPNLRITSIAMGNDETLYALTTDGPIFRLERSAAAAQPP